MNEPKTIVITGASDGIGAAAARQLHRDGHRVVVVGRSPEKTRAVAGELGEAHHLADFTRLADVRALADELKDAYPRIDVLANNAGGIFRKGEKTVDGFERTFQINHLAPFLLTQLLLDRLSASEATVIQTASGANRAADPIDVEDLDLDRDFDSGKAYNAVKLENILFTRELHRRYHTRGISAAACHPGGVATSFGSDTDNRLIAFAFRNPLTRLALASPEKGADQIVWLAETRPGIDWEPGAYYVKRKPSTRVNRQAFDKDLARRLWERSEELLAQSSSR